MSYHQSGRSVAADRPIITRELLRASGEAFDRFLRAEVDAMAHACAQIPEPAQLYKDVAPDRNRAASVATIGACLTGLALNPTLPARRFATFELKVHSWFSSMRPQQQSCLRSLAEREMLLEATANVSGMRALFAIETGNVTLLDAAMDDAAAHIDALKALLAQYKIERRLMETRATMRTPHRPRLSFAGAHQ